MRYLGGVEQEHLSDQRSGKAPSHSVDQVSS